MKNCLKIAYDARRYRMLHPNPKPTTIERFAMKIRKDENGCWNWIGALEKDGYGNTFRDDNSKKWKPHRWSYQYFIGHDIEFEDFHIHHICRNKACVNPEHLRALTPAEHNALEKTVSH